MTISIRQATLEDLPILKEFEQGLIREERPFDPTIRPDPVHYYDLKALVEDSETRFLLVQADGKAVACGYATRKSPRPYLDHTAYAYFGFMYTRPEYRGRGINGQLIGELKKWAHERGLFEMRLTVYPGNTPAVRAYEKAGFDAHLLEMRFRDGDTNSGG